MRRNMNRLITRARCYVCIYMQCDCHCFLLRLHDLIEGEMIIKIIIIYLSTNNNNRLHLSRV